MRLIFLGTSDAALPTLRALHRRGHDIPAVLTQPDRPAGRGRKLAPPAVKLLAQELGLPVLQPESPNAPEFVARIAGLAPDCGVIVAYGRFLGEALLAVPKHGFVNLHGSLLPRWRGAAPVARAIAAGDEVSGATVFRVVKKMDAGPMLGRKRVEILEGERAGELEERIMGLGADLVLEVLDRLADGTAASHPQDESQVSFAPVLRKEEGRVDWTLAAKRVTDHCRGMFPWPGAWTFLKPEGDGTAGEGLRVVLNRVKAAAELVKPAPVPGTVVQAGDRLVVACGLGAVEILELQPAGKRPMSGADFVRGYRVAVGMSFA